MTVVRAISVPGTPLKVSTPVCCRDVEEMY